MNLRDLLSKEWVRLVGVLLIGVTIGAIFYPTKRIEEKISQKYEQVISSLKETHQKEVDSVKEEFVKVSAEYHSYHQETEHKISTLTSQVSELKSRQRISTYKLVKPDGTIEERSFTENEIDQSTKTVTKIQDEFKQKVDAIESKWSKIHQERVATIQKSFDSKESDYKKTIETLEKSKTVSVNEKRFGLEVGMLTDKNYYGHATADLWGPVFVGVNAEFSVDNTIGLGVGIHF